MTTSGPRYYIVVPGVYAELVGIGSTKEVRSMKYPRRLIWVALIIQWLGMAYDFAWHGLISPDFEATTVPEMVRHLSTVHVPLYIGVAVTFLATVWALIVHVRRGEHGRAIPIAFLGSVIQMAAETWHAVSHLQMSTHLAPLAGSLSFVGMLIVLGALILGGRAERRAHRLLTHP